MGASRLRDLLHQLRRVTVSDAEGLLAAALAEPGHAAIPPAAGPASARAITLAEGVLHTIFLSKVKTRLALLLVLGLLGGSAAFAGRNRPAAALPSGTHLAPPVATAEGLPRGAVARLGSPLLRHANASTLAFSADGTGMVWDVSGFPR